MCYIVGQIEHPSPFKVFRVWTKNRSTSLGDAVSDKSKVDEDFGYSLFSINPLKSYQDEANFTDDIGRVLPTVRRYRHLQGQVHRMPVHV